MASTVAIANRALSRIGWTEQIPDDGSTPIDDMTPATGDVALQQVQLWWGNVLRRMLAYPWPFATRRKALTLVTAAAEARDDWEFVYAYPDEAVKLLEVLVGGIRAPSMRERPAHRVEARLSPSSGVTGRVLLTDVEDVAVRYIALVDDPEVWPDDFAAAFVALLAFHLAPALVKGDDGKQVADSCWAEHRMFFSIAAGNARGEEVPDQEPDSEFEKARR